MFSSVIGGCELSRHFSYKIRISTASTCRFPMSYLTSAKRKPLRIRGPRASPIAGLLCESAANFQQFIERLGQYACDVRNRRSECRIWHVGSGDTGSRAAVGSARDSRKFTVSAVALSNPTADSVDSAEFGEQLGGTVGKS